METAGQYYITTITNAAIKLGPLIFYLLAGYFLFIKLPFLLYYRTLKKTSVSDGAQEEFKIDQDFQKKMEEERRREFEERMKNLGSQKKEEKRQERQKDKKEEKTSQKKQERPKSKESAKSSGQIQATPDEILFKLKPGQAFTGNELKKIYHQLLKEHHPDKFRTDHQKEFAEAKTKNINEAYQKLKKRVS